MGYEPRHRKMRTLQKQQRKMECSLCLRTRTCKLGKLERHELIFLQAFPVRWD